MSLKNFLSCPFLANKIFAAEVSSLALDIFKLFGFSYHLVERLGFEPKSSVGLHRTGTFWRTLNWLSYRNLYNFKPLATIQVAHQSFPKISLAHDFMSNVGSSNRKKVWKGQWPRKNTRGIKGIMDQRVFWFWTHYRWLCLKVNATNMPYCHAYFTFNLLLSPENEYL